MFNPNPPLNTPKQMELELRHLAPYLPYGILLLVEYKKDFTSRENFRKIEKWGLDINKPFENRKGIISCKPLLRPLSDLTQEIEHNGERFVPLEMLTIRSVQDFRAYPESPSVDWWAYKDVQKLFEYHFDVFGLLDKGLALNLSSL